MDEKMTYYINCYLESGVDTRFNDQCKYSYTWTEYGGM